VHGVVAAMIEARPDLAGMVMITFRLPTVVDAERINVVGEFNRWSIVADVMERGEDGFVARVALPVGRTYRFRYLLDGDRWENDWAADSYLANDVGGDDSVIDLTVNGPRAGIVHAVCSPLPGSNATIDGPNQAR
jgi:1,4-alpha-glucan branching enzyme